MSFGSTQVQNSAAHLFLFNGGIAITIITAEDRQEKEQAHARSARNSFCLLPNADHFLFLISKGLTVLCTPRCCWMHQQTTHNTKGPSGLKPNHKYWPAGIRSNGDRGAYGRPAIVDVFGAKPSFAPGRRTVPGRTADCWRLPSLSTQTIWHQTFCRTRTCARVGAKPDSDLDLFGTKRHELHP